MTIHEQMPLLARHEGEWVGEYIHVNVKGEVIDRHASRLQCTFPGDGPFAYYQTNTYTWADGRQEVFSFPATLRESRIWFDTDRIEGSAWEIDDSTIILTWRRKDLEGASLYEMIQLSACGRHRSRTWHWLLHGELFQRTLIKETHVAPHVESDVSLHSTGQ